MMKKLSARHLKNLREAERLGYLADARGLQSRRLARPRRLLDEVRNRLVPTGDFELTPWGEEVARHYAETEERKPVGTLLNHRIHGYRKKSVQLANDSGEVFDLDRESPVRVRMDMEQRTFTGVWYIHLRNVGWSPTCGELAWHLRNHLDLDIEVVTY